MRAKFKKNREIKPTKPISQDYKKFIKQMKKQINEEINQKKKKNAEKEKEIQLRKRIETQLN